MPSNTPFKKYNQWPCGVLEMPVCLAADAFTPGLI